MSFQNLEIELGMRSNALKVKIPGRKLFTKIEWDLWDPADLQNMRNALVATAEDKEALRSPQGLLNLGRGSPEDLSTGILLPSAKKPAAKNSLTKTRIAAIAAPLTSSGEKRDK